ESRVEAFLDESDGSVVRAALRLADDEPAAQELERPVSPEHPELDQAVVFLPRPPPRPDALAHGSTVPLPSESRQRPQRDTIPAMTTPRRINVHSGRQLEQVAHYSRALPVG